MITLINLPQPNSLDDRLDPPLGFMYIGAVLKARGEDVRIVDLAFHPKGYWEHAIGWAEVYGMTVFSTSLYLAKEVQAICKEINPNCMVVVGGPHATSLPEDMAQIFDRVVVGEGEFAFEGDLLQDNKILRMPVIQDLDTIPIPARELVDIPGYTRKVFGRKATSIATCRGCPYSCAFCCKDIFGSKVRYFSIDRVIEEIKNVIDNYGITGFIFYDDTFALNRTRFYKLCEELGKLNIIYRCNGDARNNTLEDFKRLYASGCREIAFGIESGSQRILDLVGKGATIEKNKVAIANAKEAGLITKAFLMIGGPGETRETVEETKQFMIDADPDQYTLFQFVPLPGCAIWRDPARYGIKILNKDFRNYYNIAGNNEGGMVVETEELSVDDIVELKGELLQFLRNRKQKGVLQDYYSEVGK